MQEMWVENYRCFRERQTAWLTPLTLLVGENSTGKTSFLAMARSLWDVRAGRRANFKAPPFDLGSFDEVAHDRGGRLGRASQFRAGYADEGVLGNGVGSSIDYRFEIDFGQAGASPCVQEMRLMTDQVWMSQSQTTHQVTFGTNGKTWRWDFGALASAFDDELGEGEFPWPVFPRLHLVGLTHIVPDGHNEPPPVELVEEIGRLVQLPHPARARTRLFTTAPVRSRPQRTYDPAPIVQDAEGSHVPMLLADEHFRHPDRFDALRRKMEGFGRRSGLFDEIRVRPLGKRETEPFQLQVRKTSGRLKGPWRNLIDMGYGLSQVLPLLVESLDEGPRRSNGQTGQTSLLQQPELNLHPSAQAELGSLFCELAAAGDQLIVETHSDHLMDRIRMDVRDGKTKLKPEDVSILYFERGNLDVRIHSLEVDAEGNILGAPPGYRQFFMEEAGRSLRF